jgi:hypothetical protein
MSIEPLNLPEHWKAPTDTNYQFEHQCHMGQKLFVVKNKKYNSAFKKYGLLGVIFELLGVLERIPPMTIWRHGDPIDVKKLRDLLLDVHNFSAMALILIEDNNWDGKAQIAPKIPTLDPEEEV